MDRHSRHPGCGEVVGHEVGVGDRGAEPKGWTPAVLPPRSQCLLGSVAGLNRSGQRLWIELAVTPRDRLEVGGVNQPPVAERGELVASNALDQVAFEDQVVPTQSEQIGAVHPIWCGGETQQERGVEVLDDPPVRLRGGVVELVDDDVVELPGIELAQTTAQGLHRCEDNVGVRLLLLAVVEAELCIWPDSTKHIAALTEDLLAMGHEQRAANRRTTRIEGGQPGLAETGRHHDQTCPKPLEPGSLECIEGLDLNRGRRDRLAGRFDLDADRDRFHGAVGDRSPSPVGAKQIVGEDASTGIGPGLIEAGLEGADIIGREVPLHAAIDP